MSGTLAAGSVAANAAPSYDLAPTGTFSPADQLGSVTGNAVLILPPRTIGTLIPHVIIEEHHRDDLVITDHPVEKGASITDHAFKRPAEVVIRCGWSNSGFGEGFVQAVYDTILNLQYSRIPFDVVTGKRLYKNMLIASINVTTDERTEKALLLTVNLKQIVIVQTQETTVPAASQQAMPDKTGAVDSAGTKQAVDVPAAQTSLLSKIGGFLGFGGSTAAPASTVGPGGLAAAH